MGVIMHNNILYGGGSTIEPNPQESATEQLETLGIDGDVYEVTDASAIHASDVGVANGIAELDSNGKVPKAELPSDVVYDNPTFTEASTRANIASGETIATIFGKIKKWFSDLKDLAFIGKDGTSSTKYLRGDGTWQNFPTIPTVNDGTLTIKQNNTNLGTFTANQSTASNINIECALPSDVEGSKVATGNPLTITDAAGIKAEKIEIGFAPKQDLHGYGSVWVGGAGKNKLPLTVDGIKAVNSELTWNGNAATKNNVTFTILTDNDGNVTGINANGTANQSLVFNLFAVTAFNGSYTLNGCPSGGGGSSTFNLRLFLSDNSTYISDYGNSASASISNLSLKGGITIYSGYNAQNLVFYPMLRLSSETDATFAPYSNISPITGYTSLSADGCGKNLSYLAGIGVYNTTTGVLEEHVSDTYAYTPKIKSKSTYYTVSCSLGFTQVLLYKWDENGNYLSWTILYNSTEKYNFTFEVTGCDVFAIVIRKSGSNVSDVSVFTNFMIEEGQQATTYEPFKGDSVLVQFGQTLYGGKLTILQDGSAEVYCDTGIIDDMSTSADIDWENAAGLIAQGVFPFTITGADYVNQVWLSEAYNIKYQSNWNMNNGEIIVVKTSGGSVGARLQNTSYNTLAGLKASLAGQKLVYALATPFTLHLSPVETLTLLQGINNVWTDGTTLSLTYQPDNAIGQAKGTAQELVESASTWKLFAESPNANIALPTNCKELYICVIYVTGSTSAIMYNFHILPDIITKATSYFRQGDYYTPDYFSRCEIRIRKTSNVYDTRVEHLYMNNTTDRAENTTVKVYYR